MKRKATKLLCGSHDLLIHGVDVVDLHRDSLVSSNKGAFIGHIGHKQGLIVCADGVLEVATWLCQP